MHPRLTLRDFHEGWNTQDLPAELLELSSQGGQFGDSSPSPYYHLAPQFVQMRGVIVSHKGRLQNRGGWHKASPNMGAPPLGMIRFFTPSSAFKTPQALAATNGQYLVIAAGGQIKAYDELSGGLLTLSTSSYTLNSTPIVVRSAAPSSGAYEFGAYQNRIFWADGTGLIQRWDGSSSPATISGLPAPLSGVTAGPYQAAAAVGTSGSPMTGSYTYSFTYYDPVSGMESNPSPGVSVTGDGTHSIAISAMSQVMAGMPATAQCRVYRASTTVTTGRLLTTLALGATFNDASPDSSLAVTTVPTGHDLAPAGLTMLYMHKNRLWAAGASAAPWRLYLSSLGQPEYFPTSVVNTSGDGGYLDMPDASYDNPIVGLCGSGSLLLVACRKAMYVVFGDDWTSFQVRKISDFGTLSRRSLVRCQNAVLFLGIDGMVYSVESGDPDPIALDIENTLKAIPPSELAQACAAYVDQRYVLFVPRAAGTPPAAFAYDFRSKAWSDFTDPYLAATCAYAQPGITSNVEMLLGLKSGWTDQHGQAFSGVLSALTLTDPLTPIPILLTSPAFEMGQAAVVKRAKRLRIEGVCAVPSGGAPLTVSVSAITPGRATVTHTYPMAVTNGVIGGASQALLDQELNADLCGRQIQFTISGTVTQFEINTIDLEYQYLRTKA